jgi:hypothetical protein
VGSNPSGKFHPGSGFLVSGWPDRPPRRTGTQTIECKCTVYVTDYKTNAQIAKELKITPILDKLLEYKRRWIQHVNRMPRNRLPRVMKYYSPTGRRNHGRPLKRLMDT